MSQKAWAKRWWFWLALGGVVAAFVVVGAVTGNPTTTARSTSGLPSDVQAQIQQAQEEQKATVAQEQQQIARQQRQQAIRAARPSIGQRYVYYYLKGTATDATITYQNAAGGSGQQTVQVPRSFGPAIRMPVQPGDFLYLSAQNEGAYGTITCEIMQQDGRGKHVLNRNTSSGAYAIAECDGTAR